MGNSSSNVSTGLILVVIAGLLFVLTKEKIFYAYTGNLYYVKCVIEKKDRDFCLDERNFILSLSNYDKSIKIIKSNPENQEEEAEIKRKVERLKNRIIKEVLPVHLILTGIQLFVLFMIFSGISLKTQTKAKKTSNTAPSLSEVSSLFDSKEMKKVVENFYKIAPLSKENIEKLKRLKADYRVNEKLLFAAFILLARNTINFSAGQIVSDISDEFIRGVVFSSGRPYAPDEYQDYFDVARSLLSSLDNPQK